GRWGGGGKGGGRGEDDKDWGNRPRTAHVTHNGPADWVSDRRRASDRLGAGSDWGQSGTRSLPPFVEEIVNGLRHRLADAGNRQEVVGAPAGHGLGGAEVREQRALALRADAGDVVERVDTDGLAALGAMGADGEAVRLVAQPLNEIEHRIARLEQQRLVAAGKVEMLAPGIAV